jgi:hypothetical protein
MSVLTDYIKLIPKGLKNPGLILEGIVNNIKLNFGHLENHEKEEIIRRMFICQTCPFMSTNAAADPAQNYKSDRLDEHCTFCGCNLVLKTSSLGSNCGIEAYNQGTGKDNPLELKWTKYIKPEEDGV